MVEWLQRRKVALGALALLVIGPAGACDAEKGAPAKTELSVFAASSLTEAFQDVAAAFEAAHPEIDVKLTFSGSQVLRLQLEQGAAADVFASANEGHARALQEAGVVSKPEIFAQNELVVIVPRSGTSKVQSFEDLPSAEHLVIGTQHVPVGVYTRKMLARAQARLGGDFLQRVESHVVSEESNVRLVRAKVELGEADAAVVYRTDAVASKAVRMIDIPADVNVRARYPVAIVARSEHPEQSEQLVQFLLSPAGQKLLSVHGFLGSGQ